MIRGGHVDVSVLGVSLEFPFAFYPTDLSIGISTPYHIGNGGQRNGRPGELDHSR
jgi:hypothetical protein